MDSAKQTDLLTLEILRLREFREIVLQWIANARQGGNGESFESNVNDLHRSLACPNLPIPEFSRCCESEVNENMICTKCGEHV